VVPTNGDPCAVRIVLVWMNFTYYHGMACFLSLAQQDVLVVDVKERVGTGYTLGVGGLPRADALAETAKLIGVQRIPCVLIPRVALELVLL
jgi:hypothetical protein